MRATLAYLGVCGEPAGPEAGFVSSSPDDLGEATVFTNTTRGAAWITYTWDFGDESARSHAVHPTHLYAQSGVYTVALTATSRYGRSVYADAVRVGDVCTPVLGASFVYDPLEPLAREVVTFTATAAQGTAVPPITYTWDFDDGVTSTVPVNTITHAFPFMTMEQTYTVSLTIANGCPSQEIVQRAVTVQAGAKVYLPLVVRNY
jgi:PKD repeat protein